MADAKAQLEGISSEEMAKKKPQIMGMITMVDGILTQLESAQTQEQFDQALQGAMMPIGMLMMQGMGGEMDAPAMPTAP
jgi:NAD kinase